MQVVFQDRNNSLSFKLKFIHFQTTPLYFSRDTIKKNSVKKEAFQIILPKLVLNSYSKTIYLVSLVSHTLIYSYNR